MRARQKARAQSRSQSGTAGNGVTQGTVVSKRVRTCAKELEKDSLIEKRIYVHLISHTRHPSPVPGNGVHTNTNPDTNLREL